MASICLTQANYQPHHHLQQQFQLMSGNMLLMQPQQQQAGAPAPPTKVLGTSHLQNIQPGTLGPMVAKKKYTYANMPYGEQLPSVARRNARERNRVKQVNNGFSNLRQHLPQSVINALSHGGRGASKKLSKVDTLRIAVEYIRGLQDMLDDSEEGECSAPRAPAPVFLDESSNDGSHFGYSSAGSPLGAQFQHVQHPYHSEASVSPTPSYTDSDISIGGANYLQPLALEEQQPQAQQMQFKFEPFDNYGQLGADEQPDDEELLDYISSWQEQ